MAVGDLLGDPVGVVGGLGTEPIGLEAQEVFVEGVFGGSVVDYVAYVDDARADGLCFWRHRDRLAGLDQADLVPFGVLYLEPAGAFGSYVEFAYAGDLVSKEVAAEFGGVLCVVSCAGHSADAMTGGKGQDLDELSGAEVEAGSGGVQGVGGFHGA